MNPDLDDIIKFVMFEKRKANKSGNDQRGVLSITGEWNLVRAIDNLRSQISELTAERDNLFQQLQAIRAEYAALVKAADDCVEFISGGYSADRLRLRQLRDAVKAVKK